MELINRIKFDAPSDEVLVWKYPKDDIRLGSQLIVHQSQEAVFVKGGEALDVFGPGTHTLSTGNIPLLNKVINLPFGGDTPFTAEVWFVNKTVKRDLRWGTKTPILIMDPSLNFPISVRSFGRWGMRIMDSRSFIVQLVGSRASLGNSDTETLANYFGGEIVQRMSDSLAEFFVKRGHSIFQANAFLNEFSSFMVLDIRPEFARFGIEIVSFNVESINIPDEEKKKFQEIMGRRLEIEQLSKVQVGQGYVAARSLDVLEKAATNEGAGGMGAMMAGGLGLGIGMGAGVQVGQQVGQTMNVQPTGSVQPTATTPAIQPAAAPSEDPVAKLQKLKQMMELGLISQEDYDAAKKEVLRKL